MDHPGGQTQFSRHVRDVKDWTYFSLSYVARCDAATLLMIIWMSVAPIPVLPLLPLVRLREFVRILVVFRLVLPPGAIFVVIPVVIILVAPVVDSILIFRVSMVLVLLLTLVVPSMLVILLRDGHR